MIRLPAAVLIAIASFLWTPILAADETCPGCYGSGRVGCPSCVGSFQYMWRGACSGCQGPWPPMRGGACTRCYGTGLCRPCDGKGMACLPCKGTGRVPDGVGELRRKEALQKAKEANAAGMKRVAFFEGSWKNEGSEREKRFTSRYRWEKCVGGSFLRLTERYENEEGTVIDFAAMLTFDPYSQEYVLLVVDSRARASCVRGRANDRGDAIQFTTSGENGRELRITWHLKPAERRVDFVTEIQGEDGFEKIGTSTGRRAADASDLPVEESEPAESMKRFSFLLGNWKQETRDGGGKKLSSEEFRWEARVGGHFFFAAEKSTPAGGRPEDFVSILGFDAPTKSYVVLLFSDPGKILLFQGKPSEETDAVSFRGNGIRWVWTPHSDGDRIDGVLESDPGEGEGKVLSRWTARRRAR